MTPLFDFALPGSPPRLAGHKAGDHSLCNPDSPGHGTCSLCGKTVQVNRTSASPERRRCLDCRRAQPRRQVQPLPRVCDLCGESYVPKPMHRPDQRWCSKSCTTAWRNGARPPYERQVVTGMARKVALARERRLRHAQTWDGITDEEILDRDGWRCQIPDCKRRSIRKDLKYPHPRSKSIDHIVPLSLGGDDTAVNKRAAHFGCNVARGNEMGDEQMALFGSVREPPLVTRTHNGATVRPAKPPRLCDVCGEAPLEGSKFCQECRDKRKAEAEERRVLRMTSPIHYYTCRYCGKLGVTKARGQVREVCPARTCQLARLAANNLRVRQGKTAEEANALVIEQVAADRGPGYGRWRRGNEQLAMIG